MLDGMTWRIPRALLVLIGVGAVGLCVGCDQVRLKGGPGEPGTSPQIDWPFVPVSMRIHPFTSIEYDAEHETVVLEARVELLDRLGDMTKGVGDFRFELYKASERATSLPVQEEMLYVWNVSMLTLAENQQYYDPITRTYAFRLKMQQVPPPGTAVRLFGHFADPAGRRLKTTANLTITQARTD
jgi:hypothetical protein